MNARTELSGARLPWLLACGYLLVGLPWLGSEGSFHGDESFYTDATLQMLASGDWWRPEFADGSVRLNKPLLVYWLMGLSMKACGASLFAARLPFLLAGALLVVCSARLARSLLSPAKAELGGEHPTDGQHAPWLASCLTAGNASLLPLAMRCTPDIWLVLAMTMAWVGLADLLVARRAAAAAAPWLWAGIGLAAAAKGGLALVLLLYAVVAILVLRREAGLWRGLLRSPALLLTAVVAGAALAPLWWLEADRPDDSFLADQVTTRIASSPWAALALAGEYLLSLLRHFLPWVLAPGLVWLVARSVARQVWQVHRRSQWLVFGFAGLLFVVFSSANVHRGRYLAPMYPLLAVALTPWVAAALALRGSQWLLRGLLGILAVMVVALGVFLLRVDALAAAAALVVAALAIWALQTRCRPWAVSCLLLLVGLNLILVPSLRDTFRSSCWDVAAAAARVDATFGFEPSTASIIRILSQGRHDPKVWTRLPGEMPADCVVMVHAKGLAQFPVEEYHHAPCGRFVDRLRVRPLMQVAWAADPAGEFEAMQDPVYLVQRR
jgi:4-amino-4-deoxy-L-arabinose transferase-like glycosyltransferase